MSLAIEHVIPNVRAADRAKDDIRGQRPFPYVNEPLKGTLERDRCRCHPRRPNRQTWGGFDSKSVRKNEKGARLTFPSAETVETQAMGLGRIVETIQL